MRVFSIPSVRWSKQSVIPKIREAMTGLVLNKRELALEAGVSPDTVNRLLSTGRCSTASMRKILKALELEAKEVMAAKNGDAA